MKELGYANAKPKLKKDALPTKFSTKQFAEENVLPTVTRGAYRKRRTTEILRDLLTDENDGATHDNMHGPLAIGTTKDSNETSDLFDVQARLDQSPIGQQSQELADSKVTVHRKTQTNFQVPQQSRRIQVNIPCQCTIVKQKTISVQCDLVALPPLRLLPSSTENEKCGFQSDNKQYPYPGCLDDVLSGEECVSEDDQSDYIPSDNHESDTEVYESDTDSDSDSDSDWKSPFNQSVDPANERQFLVSEGALAKLFSVCSHNSSSPCQMPCDVRLKTQRGVMVVVEAKCTVGHVTVWNSQSMRGTMPWGNLLCASNTFFTGGSAAQILKFFKLIKMPVFSSSTFLNIQRCYTIPSCVKVWTKYQTSMLETVRNKDLVLGGDGRCDSPGHCAKYGTYTLMDLQEKKILHIQLVQSNEVKNSHHMELEGLKRGLSYLEQNGCSIGELVTDRHVSVKKYMREEHLNKKHYFDVWHMSKGVGKKLEAAAKKAGCASIRPWIKSTTNHMYWVAASCIDDEDLKVDKWLSVGNHVANKHEGHSKKFPHCEHGPLEEDRHWLKEGSKPYKVFIDIVSSGYLVRDLAKLSPGYQTYSVEVFHNVVNHFAPKNTHYFHASMMARMYLAALHYNENGDRQQATDEEGSLKWKMVYPKPMKGEAAVVKPIKSQTTFDYADDLRQAVIDRRLSFTNYSMARKDADEEIFYLLPPDLTKTFTPFKKDDSVAKRQTRYQSQ